MPNKKLCDLTNADGYAAYRRNLKVIEFTRWGGTKFWGFMFVIFLFFCSFLFKGKLQDMDIYSNIAVIILIISFWLFSQRMGYEEGFKDGYEFGHNDGAKGAVKHLNNLDDEDISMIEEMETLSEVEELTKKKKL